MRSQHRDASFQCLQRPAASTKNIEVFRRKCQCTLDESIPGLTCIESFVAAARNAFQKIDMEVHGELQQLATKAQECQVRRRSFGIERNK